MNIEQVNSISKHNITPYTITVIRDPETLASIYLEIEDKLKLIVSVKIEENKELDSTFDLGINSKTSQLEDKYRVYTNQLSRVISEAIFIKKYKKSHFLFNINLIDVKYKTDILCHMVNALMLAIMLSKIEMKYFPASSTCFIDNSERIYTEEEVKDRESEFTQVYLCKKLSNDDEIVSFKISGGHIDDKHIDKIFSYLCGSANVIGRKMLEFIHDFATN